MSEATRTYFSEEEEAFINGIEFAIDCRIPISDAEFVRYQELIGRVL